MALNAWRKHEIGTLYLSGGRGLIFNRLHASCRHSRCPAGDGVFAASHGTVHRIGWSVKESACKMGVLNLLEAYRKESGQ